MGDQAPKALRRRESIAVIAGLLALAATGWAYTARQAVDMSGMATGLGQIGAGMPNDMTPALFMMMWLAMMAAMMLPTVAPMVLAHRMVIRSRGEGWLPTAAFVGGYLLVWTAIGLVPLIVFLAIRSLMAPAPGWIVPLSGAVLVGAGIYQFTPWKGACLKACRSPLHFILTHDFRSGSRGSGLAGMSHGAWCVGCCWALMTVLVVVGLMNLLWMAAIALVFLLEKNWRYGVALTRVAGVAVALTGLVVLVLPQVLSLLAIGRA